MQKTSTLTEVAEEAGVSLITASRALRGVGRVAKETRERVLAAAAKLD
jgi:LacI family transcriptional regulator